MMARSRHGRNRALMGKAAMAGVAVAMVMLVASGTAHGQRTTEQFIPLGQSPGLSGIVTYAGEITGVDAVARSITMSRPGEAGIVTLTIARQTRIWLDRSLIGRPNLTGTFADLAPGAEVEIHFQDPERHRLAEWIKIRSDRPG